MRLIVDSLSLERGARRIVDGLSFTLAAGEALQLTGPNGAGKTTLLRATAGYLAPVGGSIMLENGAPEREIAEQCHYVGHRDGVKAGLSVLENAAFWLRFLGASRDPADALQALAKLGIAELAAVPAAYLSAGQRRRLGLVRLVLAERRVWLLDEPTVSLDASGVTTLAGLVQAHLANGGLVIAATHVPLGFEAARELRLGARAAAS